jgi:hypothetical protein
MGAKILEGDVFSMLPTIAPGSIDAVCSSPPYFRLRSYLPPGHPLKALELGQEKTPQEWVANQVRVLSLVRTCLADHGVVWWNVGDSYANTPGNGRGGEGAGLWDGGKAPHRSGSKKDGVATGSLCLVPQRLQIALADDGWIVRSQVVWHKPACMPTSVCGWQWRRHRIKVKDQGRGQARQGNFSNHSGNKILDRAEYVDCPGCPKCEKTDKLVLRKGSWRPTSAWEPVLMLAKGPGYFSDGEPVKTPAAASTVSRDRYTRVLDDPDEQFAVAHDHETTCDSGANLRDVWRTRPEDLTREELIELVREMAGNGLPDCWTIASESLKEAHYAAFPTELVRRCLLSSVSAKGYCSGKIKKLRVKKDLTPEQRERVEKWLRRKGLTL